MKTTLALGKEGMAWVFSRALSSGHTTGAVASGRVGFSASAQDPWGEALDVSGRV